jgi:hypothetical protein
MVDEVILFDDTDGSAKEAIKNVRTLFPNDLIIFANGGDRVEGNTLELNLKDENLKFVWGVGGTDKINSSSWILNKWKT